MPQAARHLLLVEDDLDLRSAMAELLSDHGYEVLEAANGMEALATARSSTPALILLDLMMPVMDGWTFLTQRAEDPLMRVIPVIVLSAQRPANLPSDADVIAVLKKPAEMDALLSIIDRACASRH